MQHIGPDNDEWREYFAHTRQKINELQTQIARTDREIDQLVYALYELSAAEISRVERVLE